MSQKTQTDRILLKRFASGSKEAFQELYDRHSHALFQYAYRRSGDAELASDLLQTVFHRLIADPARFLHAQNLKSYLFGAVHKELLHQQRKKRSEAVHLDVLSQRFVEAERFGQDEAWAPVLVALRRLDPEEAELILLHVREELSFREIGEMMGLSTNAVSSRYYAAREKLKTLIEVE